MDLSRSEVRALHGRHWFANTLKSITALLKVRLRTPHRLQFRRGRASSALRRQARDLDNTTLDQAERGDVLDPEKISRSQKGTILSIYFLQLCYSASADLQTHISDECPRSLRQNPPRAPQHHYRRSNYQQPLIFQR